MIDLFSLGLCHALLAIAALRLVKSRALDDETTRKVDESPARDGWGAPRA